MKEKIKKIIKITDQCINQELTCDLCNEKLFLKPVYLIKSEVNLGNNLGHIICEKCAKGIEIKGKR